MSPQTSRIFLNLSNHPSGTWSIAQKKGVLALGFDEVLDLPEGMPHVDPHASEEEIEALADEIMARAASYGPAGAHIAGEFSLTFALMQRAKAAGWRCYFATTSRMVQEQVDPDGTSHRRSIFQFVRWRRTSCFEEV